MMMFVRKCIKSRQFYLFNPKITDEIFPVRDFYSLYNMEHLLCLDPVSQQPSDNPLK